MGRNITGDIAEESKFMNESYREAKHLKYDDYIVYLGEFGRYQKLLYAALLVPAFCNAFPTLSVVFTFWKQPFRCAVPELRNDTYAIQGNWHEELINESIPIQIKDGIVSYSQCKRYDISNFIEQNNRTRPEINCNTWVYDTSTIKSTVISDMDLVCDKDILPSHATMAYFGGVLCGSVIMGVTADINGRKPVLCLSAVLMLITNISIVWVHSFIAIIILRFLAGVANMGAWVAAIVIGLELVGPSRRRYTGLTLFFVWCVGELYLLGMAYWLRYWRDLQLAGSFPIVFIVLYCWFLPESPRWLISRGKIKEAQKILSRAAKVNKVTLNKDIKIVDETEDRQKLQILPLLKSPRLIIRFLIITFHWMALSVGYYGLTLNSGSLGGDIYVNFLASVIVEFIGYLLCFLLMDRLGRRIVQCGSLGIGGIACLCTIFTTLYADASLDWITIALSNIGKCGVSASFGVIYVYTAELFPTKNRSVILGISNVIGRLAGMTSPYIADLGSLVESRFGKALPVIVSGSVMLAAGISALFLPETLKTKLPENVQDAKDLGRMQKTENAKRFTYENKF